MLDRMGQPRRQTRAEAIAWLRRKLTALRDEPEDDAPEGSAAQQDLFVAACLPADELVSGVEAGVWLRDGSELVGHVCACAGAEATLRLWGSRRTVCVPLADVEHWRVVGPHTWRQAHAVARRQR